MTSLGFSFDSQLRKTLIQASTYTTELDNFIVEYGLEEQDIATAKYETMSTLYPQIYKYVDGFEFSTKANKPLEIPEAIADVFI